jgi:hypothetical protein
MYVLDNVGFIAHPNTGSRSLRVGLMDAGADQVRGHHEVCTKTLGNVRACVCVIRNPYHIMASWYCKKHRPGDFHVWVSNVLQGRRNFQGPGPGGLFYGLIWATHVVKFERLPTRLDEVTEELGLPKLILGQEGMSDRTPEDYDDLYKRDNRAAFLVRKAFDFQITKGKYKFPCTS